MFKYKIILAGQENVGKSSLIARFCDNVFNEEMQSTIGVSFKRKKIQVEKNIMIDVNIWDFGGEERYRLLFPAYLNGASAALILYDTTNRESFEDIQNWIQIIDENTDNIVKVIIGAKSDLVEKKEVPFEEARALSSELKCGGIPIETSSKTGENVEQAFMNVAQEILKKLMQKCKVCGELFNRKLKICNYCGSNVELNVILS